MGVAGADWLTVSARRRARRLACGNAATWALGNGLANSWLVLWFAMDLGVWRLGLGLSLIRAAPQLAGLLRLGAPAMIGRLASRKALCITAYLASTLVLGSLPVLTVPGRLPSAAWSLAALVAVWCLYHLLEYVGTVALWSWLGDLVPQRVRGRFLGRRERWMLVGQTLGMLASGLLSLVWHRCAPSTPGFRWLGYVIPLGLGTLLMAASVVPLVGMPAAVVGRVVRAGANLRALLAPLTDRTFLRLLAFGCWLSFFNGLTLPVQDSYLRRSLGLAVLVPLVLQVALRLGQLSISPWIGRLADRHGNRRVMVVCVPLIAAAPLCYCLARPAQPWWVVGAWLLWIAYVGVNVCLPNLLLSVSPRTGNTPAIATYYAVTGLAMAASTICGGLLLDAFAGHTFFVPGLGTQDYWHLAFLGSWIARSFALVLLLAVIEPHPGRLADG
jgi:MFS family permease